MIYGSRIVVRGHVCQKQGYVCQVCAMMCANFEKQESQQPQGLERCVPCVPPKSKLKFDLENKMSILKNRKYNLEKAGTHGTTGTHCVKCMIVKEKVCARNVF